MRRLNLILFGIATLFFLYMLHNVGLPVIWSHVVRVGYYWPLLLLPYGAMTYLATFSWKCLLVAEQACPSLRQLFYLRIAGESLNQLTPAASLGGEPYKVLRLKERGVPWQNATASLVIHKGLLFLSLVLYIFLSLALVPFVLPGSRSQAGFFTVAALLLAGAGVLFLLVQRGSPCVSGIRLLEKCRVCPRKLRAKKDDLAALDKLLSDFYHAHIWRGLLALGCFFLGWLIQGAEVYLIFSMLGHRVSLGTALCLDALAMIFTGLGFMIPISMGIQDGGNILLSLGFNLGATLGTAFTIVRRLREVFWLGIGLLLVVRNK